MPSEQHVVCDGAIEEAVETADVITLLETKVTPTSSEDGLIGGITEIVKIRYNLDVIPRKAQTKNPSFATLVCQKLNPASFVYINLHGLNPVSCWVRNISEFILLLVYYKYKYTNL